jgi:hypothetical protein
MAYRVAAPPGETRASSVQRLTVARYALWAAALILLGMSAFGGFMAWSSYGKTAIVCTRAAPGAVPHCTAQDGKGTMTTHEFDLYASSFKVDQRESDDAKHTVLTLFPSTVLHGAVDPWFAQHVVIGSQAFVANGAAMRWEAVNKDTSGMYWPIALALLMIVPMLLIFRSVTIEVDADRGMLAVRNGRFVRGATLSFPFSDLRSATIEDIDDSAFFSLVLQLASGTKTVIAQGRRADVDAAARAINVALRDRHTTMAAMPAELRDALEEQKAELATAKDDAGPFAGWSDLEDDARWERMDTFLRAVPIDDAKVVRKKKDDRIEVRGQKRGHPIRVVFDPTSPSGTEVESKAKGKLGFIDVEYDPDAKQEDEPAADPTWDEPGERRTFFAPSACAPRRRRRRVMASCSITATRSLT